MGPLFASVLLATGLSVFAPPLDDGANAEPRRCCFTHPRYTGVCVVEPEPTETCESMLAYLNDPMSSGKTYCESTEIRGGWEEAQCPPARDEATAAPPGRPAATQSGEGGLRACGPHARSFEDERSVPLSRSRLAQSRAA